MHHNAFTATGHCTALFSFSSFVQFVVATRDIFKSKRSNAERWTLQSTHCRNQIMQCYWMPQIQVFREQFEQILQKDLRRWHFEVNMLTRGRPQRSTRMQLHSQHSWHSMNFHVQYIWISLHFHGSSSWQVNLRAELVSLQCMCYTQSPKYVDCLPVQRVCRVQILWKQNWLIGSSHASENKGWQKTHS